MAKSGPDDDSDLERRIKAGSGRFAARAHPHDRPAYARTPVMHNPYLNVPLATGFVGAGIFMLSKADEVPPWILIPFVGLLWVAGLVLVVWSALRAPAWHRARKIAREYVAEHGGTFPADLKWHS